ncbi:MFS transporter [Embleya sp. NBC_00896]|uniref:MFS transporter n=1 Tax=Embleya sp. NBC_00896 TaxID=2975961 RepID=UPI00386CD090|nr:MFS transporter [Embleya sp. NBC_00896]
MIDTAAPALVRDRATWLLYLHMAAFGYFLYCFGPSVTLLGDDLGVGNAVAALHSTAYAAAGVLIALLGDRPMRRFGRGPTLWAGCGLLSLGVLAYCAAETPAVSLSAALLSGFGAFLVVNVAGTALADHHGTTAGPSALNEANGLAAGVGMAAPLLIGVMDSSGPGWRWAMYAVPLLFGALALGLGRTRIPDLPALAPAPVTPEAAAPGGPLPAAYWWAWLLTVCSVAVEFSLSLWASTLLRDRTGMSESAAATGMTAVVAGLCLGRLVGGRLALRLALHRLYISAVALNLVGFTMFWSATVPWLAYLGLFVSGLGMSVQFPLATAAAIRAAGGRADLAVSRLAVATTIAAGGAPFLLGLATDLMPVRAAFLLLPILLVASIPILIRSTRTHG